MRKWGQPSRRDSNAAKPAAQRMHGLVSATRTAMDTSQMGATSQIDNY